MLNNYFGSVFVEDDGTKPNINKANVNSELNDIKITMKDIERKIDELKPGKSPGPDNINTSLLKNLNLFFSVKYNKLKT